MVETIVLYYCPQSIDVCSIENDCAKRKYWIGCGGANGVEIIEITINEDFTIDCKRRAIHETLNITHVQFSIDTNYMAIASLDGHLCIWHITDKTTIDNLFNNKQRDLWIEFIDNERITSISFSYDSIYISISCWNNSFYLYKNTFNTDTLLFEEFDTPICKFNLFTAKSISITGNAPPVFTVWTNNNSCLAVTEKDNSLISVYNIDSGLLLYQYSVPFICKGLFYSINYGVLLSFDRNGDLNIALLHIPVTPITPIPINIFTSLDFNFKFNEMFSYCDMELNLIEFIYEQNNMNKFVKKEEEEEREMIAVKRNINNIKMPFITTQAIINTITYNNNLFKYYNYMIIKDKMNRVNNMITKYKKIDDKFVVTIQNIIFIYTLENKKNEWKKIELDNLVVTIDITQIENYILVLTTNGDLQIYNSDNSNLVWKKAKLLPEIEISNSHDIFIIAIDKMKFQIIQCKYQIKTILKQYVTQIKIWNFTVEEGILENENIDNIKIDKHIINLNSLYCYRDSFVKDDCVNIILKKYAFSSSTQIESANSDDWHQLSIPVDNIEDVNIFPHVIVANNVQEFYEKYKRKK